MYHGDHMEMDPPDTGDDAPAARKARTATRLKVAGAALTVTLGSLWLLRFPLLGLAAQGYLGGRGIDADFSSDALTPGRLEISDLRLGAADRPDFTARRAIVRLRWQGLMPEIAGIVLDRPVARVRLDENGLSLGRLDRLLPPPSDEPLSVPGIAVIVRDGRVVADTPLGPLTLRLDSGGTLADDFVATARLDTARIGNDHVRLDRLGGEARLTSAAPGFTLTINGTAASVSADNMRLDTLTLTGEGRASSDITVLSGTLTLDAASARHGDAVVATPAATLTLDDLRLDPRMRPLAWSAAVDVGAASAELPTGHASTPAGRLALVARGNGVDGTWRATTDLLTVGAVATPALTARSGRAEGTLRIDRTATGLFADGKGALTISDGTLPPARQRQIRRQADALAGTPVGPLIADGGAALVRAGRQFTVSLPLAFNWRTGAGEITVPGPVTLAAASGARLALADGDGPVARLALPAGGMVIDGRAGLTGGGLPTVNAVISHQAGTPGDAAHHGIRLVIDRWTAGRASLRIPSLSLALREAEGEQRLDLSGALTLSGPLGEGHVRDLDIPLDLTATLAPTLSLAPREGCMVVSAREIRLGDTALGGMALPLCPQGGAFLRVAADGRLGGGITTPSLLLANASGPRPARLETGPASLRFTGRAARPRVEASVQAPALTLSGDGGQALTVRATTLAATLVGGERGWQASGALAGLNARDGASGVTLRDGQARWTAAPGATGPVARLTDVTAIVADTGTRPMFNPVRLADVQARLREGTVVADGMVRLAAGGAVLGRWTLTHTLASGRGEAAFTVSDFGFSPDLQPFQLSELARGVIENVSGSVSGIARARWTPGGMASSGHVTLADLSFATAALGPIDGINGTVNVDDLTALTTPPGQTLTIARINPGVAISDGTLRFQLQPDFRLALEDVRWPFAGGTLAVAPTVLDPATERRTLTLTLSDIDVATFLAQMQLSSLAATGTVDGEMPLVLSRTGAAIRGGELHSKNGGLIAYTGDVGRKGELGQGQIAFDALRSFRYDSIIFEVDGDLAGDLVTAIRFAGVTNADVAPMPGVRMLKASGLPFRFNVNIRAPFGRLARSFAEFAQPEKALKQALDEDAAAGAAEKPQ